MAARGKTPHTFGKWKFRVFIERLDSMAYQSCSGFKVNIGVAEYSEGGTLAPYKYAGMFSYDNVTFERGLTYNEDVWRWIQQLGQMTLDDGYGGGDVHPLYKRNGNALQLERDGSVAIEHEFYEGFPADYTAGDWDNTADEVTMENFTLAYRYFVKRNRRSEPT